MEMWLILSAISSRIDYPALYFATRLFHCQAGQPFLAFQAMTSRLIIAVAAAAVALATEFLLLHVLNFHPTNPSIIMKNLALLLSLAAVSLGFSSCCSMFGTTRQAASYRTETRQVKTCGYDIVTEEVVTPGDAKSGKGGMVQTIEKKVPRYKTVTKKVRVPCGPCVRFYLPEKRLLRHHFRVHPA